MPKGGESPPWCPPSFGLGAVFAGRRPRAELATPRIGCSVTTRKPGPGRSEPAADGVPQPVCSYMGGMHPDTPSAHSALCLWPLQFQPGVHCSAPWSNTDRTGGALRSLPLVGSLFSAAVFSSFGGLRAAGWVVVPRALFLSIRAGKGKCHPVLCMKGIINSTQLHLNLPILTSLPELNVGNAPRSYQGV